VNILLITFGYVTACGYVNDFDASSPPVKWRFVSQLFYFRHNSVQGASKLLQYQA
jgi:hypothetical protein